MAFEHDIQFFVHVHSFTSSDDDVENSLPIVDDLQNMKTNVDNDDDDE